jgi:hypothetical protein
MKQKNKKIDRVQLRDALAQNAYILFYNRTLTPTPVATTHLINDASLENDLSNKSEVI